MGANKKMEELQHLLNNIEQIEERIQELYKELEEEKRMAKKAYDEIGKAYDLVPTKKVYKHKKKLVEKTVKPTPPILMQPQPISNSFGD